MAIQNRRGVYSDFTPSKMVPGELAVVQSGDPNNTSGKAVYAAFGASGDVKRLATEDDLGSVDTALENKVDKVTGKGLSTNDYTTEEKNKLSGIEAQANKTVIDSTLTQTGQAADAKAVGDAIDSVTIETDKTLTEEDVPADAKVVGDELADVRSDLADWNVNQHIKVSPFVVGSNTNVGTMTSLRTSITILQNGGAKIERSSTSTTLSYGFFVRVETDGSVDFTGHKIYIKLGGIDITNATHFSALRLTYAYNSKSAGHAQEEFTTVPENLETIISPDANINQFTVLIVPGDTVTDGEYFSLDYAQFIDLTAMFGAGNEPTLDEFRSIYAAKIPYPYGKPVVDIDRKMIKTFVENAKAEISETTFFRLPDVKANSDLNDFVNIGYQLLFNNYTYNHWPAGLSAGSAWLFVLNNVSGTQILQILVRFTTGETYYRRSSSTGASWYDWIKLSVGTDLLYKDLAGKKISIVGDSISTYDGYNPDGYAYYYPKTGLNDVNQTWWKQVADTVGASILVNASWSGSWVCYDSSVSADSAKVAYTDARINALANGSTAPDIIIVLIGTNDFIHNGGNPIGTLDENSEIPDGTTPITDFKPAYAHMINKIMTTYPDAHVYCCTLIERYRGTDAEYPIKNGNGVALAAYNKAIVDIALWMGCNIIRLDTAFSLGKVPDYTVDGTLHPNAAGAKLIANQIVGALANGERKYVI